MRATGADIRHGGGRAFYSPADDYVQLPPFQTFRDGASYYGTGIHELAHWSGHGTRCDRDLRNRFGSEAYAAEEGRVPEKAAHARLRHLATMRIARAGLALLELRQETGAWPATLDAVVPLVGAETIVDPYMGARLRYEPGARLEAAAPVPREDFRDEYEVVWRF